MKLRYKLFLAGVTAASGYLCLRAYVNSMDFATPLERAIRNDPHPVHAR